MRLAIERLLSALMFPSNVTAQNALYIVKSMIDEANAIWERVLVIIPETMGEIPGSPDIVQTYT